jgi:hypothetical protein
MHYKKINNITGWAVCLVACTVYLMTMEASGSLWDCGEFASSAYKLQNPHPPGAPLFVLIGRLFMIPFGPENAVRGLNAMSALASGFTILFLFWNITHFGRKIIMRKTQELTKGNVLAIMAAGVVGALAYTFSDSFWYSAVEGEVYALSSFFTAVVFWAILKWEQAVSDEQAAGITGRFTRADRWLILIFYLMGLSIGVHLLNLLTLPALVMVYYFKRYKATVKGGLIAFLVGIVITGFVQKMVIQWSIKWAGDMDILFVNSFGLPFFVGFAFFFVLLGLLIYLLVWMANSNNWHFLKLGAWGFAFMMIGYLTYLTPLVRSSANPSIDMFNVDNPVALFGYVGREQYGDWPILYGQYFTDEMKLNSTGTGYEFKDEGPIYTKAEDQYIQVGDKKTPVYEDNHFFPRMWDGNNDKGQSDFYAKWAGIEKITYTDEDGREKEKWSRAPTFTENLTYFFGYQLNWMYMRYFMWNFAGKQNDIASSNPSNVRDGNWISGIGFLDNLRLGDQKLMPDSMKSNKANNKLYLLPLLLGLAGLSFQFVNAKKDALITILLFFFTGIAIILYLNQTANQPRERDYAFVGSFYAFSIWIGLGVLMISEYLNTLLKNSFTSAALAGCLCLFAVPGNMAYQEWDDHDRSNKTIARDLARDYLDGCPENAVLVTFGDNDTYPLWYVQEVEGYRTDVRVINSSLLGADWNINQLRYKVNNSAPVELVWNADQIMGSNRDQIVCDQSLESSGQPMDLYKLLKDYAGNDMYKKDFGGYTLCTYPTMNVSLPVDADAVYKSGTVDRSESIPASIQFMLPYSMVKNDAAILNIIAANKWKRPVCFTSPYSTLGFGNYLRQNGMTYLLTPIANAGGDNFNTVQKKVVDQLMNFGSGNADQKGVYFDEENRRHLLGMRSTFASAAMSFTDKPNATKQDTLTAKRLLEKCDLMINEANVPYAMMSDFQRHNYTSMILYIAARKSRYTALADKIINELEKDYNQQKAYYNALKPSHRLPMTEYEIPSLINMFLNSKWEIASFADKKVNAIMIDYKNFSDSSNGQVPMPFLSINNGNINCFTGAVQFETALNTIDFENLSINFTPPATNDFSQESEGKFMMRGVIRQMATDPMLEMLKKANGYKFENHFETLIITSDGKELMRFKKSF